MGRWFFILEIDALDLEIRPKIGAGMIIQYSEITGGTVAETSSRYSATGSVGMGIHYHITDKQDIVLDYSLLMVSDSSIIQYQLVGLGIGFRL